MGFNINDFLNAESKKSIKSDWKPVKVDVRKLRPSPDKINFYHAGDKEIKDLAESIELIGLQQYSVIRAVEGTDEYEVIAGHKRRLAILRLLSEGKSEYEMIPCKIETLDDIRNELVLIFTNSTQRERTDYEKMREIGRVRELLIEYQKTHELTGRKQSIIAEILGTSKTKVGTLDNINNNLIEPFKKEFAVGKISTNAANEIAGLLQGAQKALYETYKETGALTAKDTKLAKGQQKQPGAEAKDASEQTKEREKARGKQCNHSTNGSGTNVADLALKSDNVNIGVQDDLKDWAACTVKELGKVSNYLTEAEINTLQSLIMRCKERSVNNKT